MKKTLIYIILFLGFIVVIDYSSGIYIEHKFSKISFGDYGTINRGISTKAEIIILGSSRAQHHYNPDVINSSLKKSIYNTGLGGHGLFYNYAVLHEILKTNKPEMVVLDISPNIIVDPQAYSKLNILLPYYDQSEAFREIIQLNPKFSRLELFSNLYVYNSTLYDLLRTTFSKSNTIENGYKPLNGEIDENNFSPFYLEAKDEMDSNQMLYLSKIIELCQTNNITFLGIVSPTYKKFDVSNRIIYNVDSIFTKNNLHLYDYSSYVPLYNKSKYFKDQLHLNMEGTAIFSEEISRILSSNIQK